MLIESENCKNVDFYDNKNMIVRNEINRALVHIDVIWYMRILSERNGLRHRHDFIICVFLYLCFTVHGHISYDTPYASML